MRNFILLYFISINLAFSFSRKVENGGGSSTSSSSSSSVASTNVREKILNYVASSACYKKNWKDRGQIPLGFLQGMALTFYKNKGQAPRSLGSSDKDAFRHYGISDTSKASEYAFLVGLSMRESSGRHCVGRDASANNTNSETCETGAFQFSYNSRTADSSLLPLYGKYKADKSGCELDLFAKNVTCSAANWRNYGSGEGVIFQDLAKKCPVFATEYAAILIRSLRRHFGPINRKEVEYSPVCVSMFKEIEKF